MVYVTTSFNSSEIIIHILNSYTGFYPVYGTICVFIRKRIPTYYKSHVWLLLSLAIKHAPTNNYILLVVKVLLIDWQINGFAYNKILFQAETFSIIR
jgi:hypothetical protein